MRQDLASHSHQYLSTLPPSFVTPWWWLSWWVNQFCFTLPPSNLLTFFPSVLSLSPEQGRQTTLSRSHVKLPPTLRTHPIRDGLRLDDFLLTSGIRDSVHYPPSIHSRVLRGSSCRAVTVEPPTNYQNPQPLSLNDVLSPTSKAWCHVYSNRMHTLLNALSVLLLPT